MTERTQRLLPSWHYPTVMVLAFVLFALLQQSGFSLGTSTYVPIVFTALVVAFLERLFPFRRVWQPDVPEMGTDFLFLTVVQLALPPIIGFGFHLRARGARAGTGICRSHRSGHTTRRSGHRPC